MLFEPEFWTALLSIIMIDLVLAGDNAVVIAMASRNLPALQRKKAILWGTFGAVVVRIIMTLGAVWLLKIPLLQAIGGILLVYIAIKLLIPEDDGEKVVAGLSLNQAIKTIIFADIIMGMDNVLAIAGASHGNFVLVVIGLIISIPIVVWGSQLISAWMTRFPIIVYIGAAVLAWTAGTMFVHDDFIEKNLLTGLAWLNWLIPLVATAFVIGLGFILSKMKKTKSTEESLLDKEAV
jgi:YjbE family integral membrane protein